MTREEKIKKLRREAEVYDELVSSNADPSSQEWISPERREHYYRMAYEKRLEANELEKKIKGGKK